MLASKKRPARMATTCVGDARNFRACACAPPAPPPCDRAGVPDAITIMAADAMMNLVGQRIESSSYFQRSIALRCSESAGSSASSMRMPFGSVMFERIAFVGLTRVSDTFAPRCLNMAVAAAMFST